jgi:hypothetical protein
MENRSIAQIGVVSRQDVLESKNAPRVSFDEIKDSLYGGNFLSGLKRFGEKALRGVEEALPYAERAYKIGKQVAPYAEAVAPLLMAAGERKGGVVVGGRRKKKGGRMMNRSQLRRRLAY